MSQICTAGGAVESDETWWHCDGTPHAKGGTPMNPFAEIKPALELDQALAESARCLFCYDAPCTRACPTHIDVPAFIKKILTGNVRGSARTILSANVLGGSC